MRTEVGNHILLIPLHEQIHLPHQVGRDQENRKHNNYRCLTHVWCSFLYSPYRHEKGMQNFMPDDCF